MLSDASVEKQCQLCAQDVSENYCEEHLEEFVKESRQTLSPDELDWQDGRGRGVGAGLLADCKPSKNRSLAGNPWGAVYHGRDYAVDQEVALIRFIICFGKPRINRRMEYEND
uniref:hypothetical protein n=1 Tax=Dialister sp. TaxID=1955814 RepID=UPI004026DBA7